MSKQARDMLRGWAGSMGYKAGLEEVVDLALDTEREAEPVSDYAKELEAELLQVYDAMVHINTICMGGEAENNIERILLIAQRHDGIGNGMDIPRHRFTKVGSPEWRRDQ